jgi:hypothetical protein
LEPDTDFPAQVVLQLEPLTVPTTVTLVLAASDALIVPLVEPVERRFTPPHAVSMAIVGSETGSGVAVGAGVETGVGPPLENRHV